MNRLAITLSSLLLTLTASSAFAQAQPTPEQMAAMLEEMRPTTEHQDLAKLTGRWNQEVTWSMGGAPVKAAGVVTNRLILGGRFLVSEGSSNNPLGFGDSTIELMTIYGFDRRTGDYTIVGYDSFGTYYVTAAGKKTTAGLVLMHGETLEHEAGTKALRKYDMTLRLVDANTYITEVIFKVPGQPDQTIASVTHRRIQ
jgi:Protein of unknown function (DUF1579)